MRLSLPLGLVISLACAGFSLADDPTRPLYTPPDPAALALHAKTAKPATPAEPVLRVDYLLYAPQRRLVRINGELLSEGRHIQGWTVTRIESSRVLLQRGKQQLSLPPYSTTSSNMPAQDTVHAQAM